jgi:hypothetical protein
VDDDRLDRLAVPGFGLGRGCHRGRVARRWKAPQSRRRARWCDVRGQDRDGTGKN